MRHTWANSSSTRPHSSHVSGSSIDAIIELNLCCPARIFSEKTISNQDCKTSLCRLFCGTDSENVKAQLSTCPPSRLNDGISCSPQLRTGNQIMPWIPGETSTPGFWWKRLISCLKVYFFFYLCNSICWESESALWLNELLPDHPGDTGKSPLVKALFFIKDLAGVHEPTVADISVIEHSW